MKRVLWRGGPVEKLAAVSTAIVAVLALLASVLSSVSLIDVSGEVAQSFGLLGLSAVLTWLLSEAHRREVQEGEHRRMLARTQQVADLLSANLPDVRQIPADDVAVALEGALDRSQNWSFRGGSGRWLRHASLPRMATLQESAPVVHVHLLDPRSEHLCRDYAKYRSRQRTAEDVRPDESNPRTIQSDILASIAALYWHASASRMRPHALLLQTFSPLRYDIADEAVIVTVANKSSPALLARKDSWFYNSIVDEIEEAHRAGAGVIQGYESTTPRPASPTALWVENVLRSLVVGSLGDEQTPLLEKFAAADLLDFDEIARRVLGSNA